MEENNFGYGFEHDDYGRFEQDIDQDTAYVIRPEQMGGGASPQPQIKRTIPIVTIALIVANVIAGIMCIGVDNYSRTCILALIISLAICLHYICLAPRWRENLAP